MTSPADLGPPPPVEPQVKPVVSGIAVVLMFAGVVLVISGGYKSRIRDVLRAVIKGDPIPKYTLYTSAGKTPPVRLQVAPGVGGTTGVDHSGELVAPGGTATGARVATIGMSYIGVPYVWAGETPDGWDCSGFVTYVLSQAGLSLPDNYHTTAARFYVWSGAQTIPRSAMAPGDLLCWPSHVAIAVSSTEMVNAPGLGQKTRVDKIWRVPEPVVRRPKAYK